MTPRLRTRTYATLVFCGVPTVAVVLTSIIATQRADDILTSSDPVFGLPFVWLIVPLAGTAAVATLVASFVRSVRGSIAVCATFLNVLAALILFASLFQASGVFCTAPVCVDPIHVAADDPYLVRPLGTELPVGPIVLPEPTADSIVLSRNFTTAFYFSAVTFTTLGYGDMQPLPALRLVAGFEATFGYLMLGLLIGVTMESGQRFRNRPRRKMPPPTRNAMIPSRAKDEGDTQDPIVRPDTGLVENDSGDGQ